MCVYCFCGDWHFRHDPPWAPNENPAWPWSVPVPPWPWSVPVPLVPVNPWPVEKLKEFEDLLKRIKALEDAAGCPCEGEEEKPDYLDLLRKRIEKLEKDNGFSS